mmetsp:Transcript_14266/g.35418  ORF Transcript_14266/g.35418 Transcript_14266/m.35418 type:complete len:307 (+) Transcript_14266:3030-3950(+)
MWIPPPRFRFPPDPRRPPPGVAWPPGTHRSSPKYASPQKARPTSTPKRTRGTDCARDRSPRVTDTAERTRTSRWKTSCEAANWDGCRCRLPNSFPAFPNHHPANLISPPRHPLLFPPLPPSCFPATRSCLRFCLPISQTPRCPAAPLRSLLSRRSPRSFPLRPPLLPQHPRQNADLLRTLLFASPTSRVSSSFAALGPQPRHRHRHPPHRPPPHSRPRSRGGPPTGLGLQRTATCAPFSSSPGSAPCTPESASQAVACRRTGSGAPWSTFLAAAAPRAASRRRYRCTPAKTSGRSKRSAKSHCAWT